MKLSKIGARIVYKLSKHVKEINLETVDNDLDIIRIWFRQPDPIRADIEVDMETGKVGEIVLTLNEPADGAYVEIAKDILDMLYEIAKRVVAEDDEDDEEVV